MPSSAAVPIAGNRFLIVGGASLVGSATAAELLDHGAAEVALFDNFAFGSEDAVAHLRDHPRLRLVRGDVMRLPELLRASEGLNERYEGLLAGRQRNFVALAVVSLLAFGVLLLILGFRLRSRHAEVGRP